MEIKHIKDIEQSNNNLIEKIKKDIAKALAKCRKANTGDRFIVKTVDDTYIYDELKCDAFNLEECELYLAIYNDGDIYIPYEEIIEII